MDLEGRIAALRADRERGSAALATEALDILEAAARGLPREGFDAALRGVAQQLAAARPAMVALENRVNQVLANALVAEAPEDALPTIVIGLCDAARAGAALERAAAAQQAASLLAASRPRRVATISWSDTVAEALRAAAKPGPFAVVLPEGAPLGDGKCAAARLGRAGLAVDVVPDGATAVEARRADAGLVGADAVLGDGSVVNRAGTRAVAGALREAGKPLWVVCEEAKVTWREELPLERVEGASLFDVTPAADVAAVVTERGPQAPRDLAAVAERHRQRAAWAEE